MMEPVNAKILENQEIAPLIYQMRLAAHWQAIKPGQFVNLYLSEGSMLLPRPISICDWDERSITLLYQVVGRGTAWLSERSPGHSIRMMGPLGNGFFINEKGPHILVGGGVGLAPLVGLSKRIEGEKQVFLGYPSKSYLSEQFKRQGIPTKIATDDGSEGTHGTVMDCLRENPPWSGTVYACGPKKMLEAVSLWSIQQGLKVQVSMEERMACGFGVCVGCPVKIQRDGEFISQKVCKDGPVFWGNEVGWQ